MKLIKVQFSGIENFTNPITIDLYAEDKITGDGDVSLVSKPIYSQNVLAFVGSNASGKTTALNLLALAINIVVNNYGLDQIRIDAKALIKEETIMSVLFYHDDKYYYLVSTFTWKNNDLIFKDEKIATYTKSEIRYKKQIHEIEQKQNSLERKAFVHEIQNGVIFAIKDTDSIVSAIKSNVATPYANSLKAVNISNIEELNPDYLRFFDRGIENAFIKEDNLVVKYKWKDKADEVKLDHVASLLSSGTIKGSILFNQIAELLKSGGYLIVDDIESYMNKKYVQTILNIFQDNKTNEHGATLIFSTHYIELMDSINRKDPIYVTRKDKNGKCDLVKYSCVVKRNDIKKAELLLSNYIEGTSPYYEDIQSLIQSISSEN